MTFGKRITAWLQSTNNASFSLYTALTAFCLYSCVYGFRKAFSAATFDGLLLLGISYKVWLVTAQVIGYALSKFLGIKIIAELQSKNRAQSIIWLVVTAGVSLFLFAIVPASANILFLFT
ncbi:MAG TPA: hypothetical protein DGG95_09930, partial [Cytophagales bacterium]|nr:hypothetical protein [Cytophagales bacterium]